MSRTANINPSGFTTIYEPLGEPVADIVLVHGLGGHPRRTWTFSGAGRRAISAHMESWSEQKTNQQKNRILRLFSHRDSNEEQPSSSTYGRADLGGFLSPGSNQSGDIYWPADLLPAETPNARVLVWGYESLGTRDISTDGRASLVLHGRDLLFSLHKERPAGRPLIFVAHSLGGLIVKEMLRRSQTSGETELHDILHSTKGVIFLGTPQRQSARYASFGDQTLSIASIVMQVSKTHAPLRAWGFDKPELQLSTQAFLNQWSQYNFAVKTFQESRVTLAPHGDFMNYKIVPDDSSSFGDPRERCEQLQADHKGLVQFMGANDSNFRKVAEELKRILASLGNTTSIFSEKESACLKSFWFPNITTRQQNIRPALDQTCTWLMESSEFKNWYSKVEQTPRLIWLKGEPAAGKSTLMKTTYLKTAEQDPTCNVAAFFFDANGTKLQKSPTGLWQSLIYQLCIQDKTVLTGMLKRYLDRVRQTVDGDWTWSLPELEEFVKDLITLKPRRTIVFIDALDECDVATVGGVLSLLLALSQLSFDKNVDFNVCISSRNDPPNGMNCPIIGAEQYNNDDIRQYVRKFFNSSTQNEPQALSLIENELVSKAAGSFLWIILATEYLLGELDDGNPLHLVIESIDNIPAQLDSLLKELCQGIKSEARLPSTRLFQWILFAGKELTAAQLLMAMLFSIKGHSVEMMEAWGFVKDSVHPTDVLQDYIRDASRGLVEARTTVQFIHDIVREFFLKGPGLGLVDADLRDDSFGNSSLVLANGCLSILEAPSSLQDSGCHWILTQYAQKFFIVHAKNAESRNISTRPLLSRLENPNSRLWKLLKPAPNTPLLYFLCLHQLGSSAMALIERGMSLRDMTLFPGFQIPLLGCLTFKQDREPFSLALALLKHGSPVSVINEAGNTALHLALRWGYSNIVNMLLNHYNAPLNQPNKEGDYPVHFCAKFGDSKLLDQILKKNTDLNVRNLAGATPLHIAAGAGNFVTVNDLLVYGAAVGVLDNDGHDALLHAIRGATESTTIICETLVAYGAGLETKDSHGRTPLHHACRSSKVATVSLLANKGADINAVDGNGETCLHMAAQRGAFDIIQALLDRGADTSIQNVQGLTALELGLQFSKSVEQGRVMVKIFKNSDVTSQILRTGSGKVYSWEPDDEGALKR